MRYSIGIGLTNNCDLNCAHCYRDKNQISNITLDQVRLLCKALPIHAMGMGTGENLLNPEFLQILDFLSQQGIKISVASNGHTLTSLPDKYLKLFNDVEVSIDFPTKEDHDKFRGSGNWDLVHQAIKRCKKEGVELSILTTMMSVNYDMMDKMVILARSHDVNLRVNVYQSVNNDLYHLNYEQFWEGFRLLLGTGKLISCSEPVVRAVLNLGEVYSPCGHKSIRINPQGQVIPCVYWGGLKEPEPVPKIADLSRLREKIFDTNYFRLARWIPTVAANCPCRGGCASRRALHGDLDAHDEYCPWCRNDQIKLEWHPAPSRDLVRINNNCTTIVK
ncbi:MAG: radical SAM protein [Promethearchaeota archaeon]